jgi:hypothetical protein
MLEGHSRHERTAFGGQNTGETGAFKPALAEFVYASCPGNSMRFSATGPCTRIGDLAAIADLLTRGLAPFGAPGAQASGGSHGRATSTGSKSP